MPNLIHSVTIVPGFTLTGVINTKSPDNMNISLDGIEDDAFTATEYRQYFDQAIAKLDQHFDDILPPSVDVPFEGMEVVSDREMVSVSLAGEGDGLLIANAKMADSLISASLARM